MSDFNLPPGVRLADLDGGTAECKGCDQERPVNWHEYCEECQEEIDKQREEE